ncbi:MAG: hypothetical protein JXB19_04915 [Bacteroidales bacterium]|nr:hypothetical protein [Bacteroidales bacterium]
MAETIPPWFFQKHDMKAYVASSGVISPQQTHDTTGFPEHVCETVTSRLRCLEPDYRTLINPVQLRRMPRILKMGLASAKICLERAGNVKPGAIIVGTGLGCLDNLEKFLLDMLDHDEHITSVLPFINSTHNAVASQIAMVLKNYGYNYTYCHRALSFESALQDALMHIRESPDTSVLVGGIDECTDDYMLLHNYLGYWKQPVSNLDLFRGTGAGSGSGTVAGEGSAFFLLSGIPRNEENVILEAVHTFFMPEAYTDPEGIAAEADHFLTENNTGPADLDLVILGLSGDDHDDSIYRRLRQRYFKGAASFAGFKHLCGEFYTATAFALWLGATAIANQHVPAVALVDSEPKTIINKVLIYNHFKNAEHGMMLLTRAEGSG